MIEPLLEAERAMSFGLIDQAERLYRQVAEHDPKNSIAIVGLARVALERGDDRTAYLEAKRALQIDPDNPAAQHLVLRLAEVMAERGETPPEASAAQPATALPPTPAAPPPPPTAPAPAAPATGSPAAASPAPPRPRKRRSVVDRLLGRKR
jgi:tetratricopeptide (TPR) repeat protein